jgi:predicted  nucleic acid-binding Zn-ribbon protein
MVLGWGKKKTLEKASSEKKGITISKIKPIIEEIQSIRTNTIIAETKNFQKKIESQLSEIQKIIKELENDSLNVDDIDKHLELIVVRGKTQVIDIIKKETAEKLPTITSFEDVKSLNDIVAQLLKRIGDVLGRQSRVIHIFAKKYASKLKDHLAVLNSDRAELQTLIDKHSKMNDDIRLIFEKIQSYNESKQFLNESSTRISELQKSIAQFNKTNEDTRKTISALKSGNEYTKYLAAQKKLDLLLAEKNQIKNSIDVQFTKISRPLSRYEYVSSLEKPQKILLEKLVANPFDVLTLESKDDVIKILSSVRKGIEGGSISVKDFEKSLTSIDETIESHDGFISQIAQYTKKKNELENELAIFSTKELNQKENLLTKTDSDISDAESKIKKLEKEISDIKTKLPQLITDIENRLQKVSSVKYQVIE